MPDNTTTGNVAGGTEPQSTPRPRPKRKAPAKKKPAAPTENKVAVTYDGPSDRKDPTTVITVPHAGRRADETFPINETVTTTKDTAERLAAMAGHTFTIEPAKPEGA